MPSPRAPRSRRRHSSAATRLASILARCPSVSARQSAFSHGETTPGAKGRYQGCGAPCPACSKPSASRRAMTFGCLRYEKNAARPFEPVRHADGAHRQPVSRRYRLEREEPASLCRPELLSARRHLARLARARRPLPLRPRRSWELRRHTRDWARRRKHRRHPQARC